jgi:hypothetical protein
MNEVLMIFIFCVEEDKTKTSNYLGVIQGFHAVSEAKTRDEVQNELVNRYLGELKNNGYNVSDELEISTITENKEYIDVSGQVGFIRQVQIKS